MIANRFEPLKGDHSKGTIRARDVSTAQTVVLHQVRDLDERLVGIFHPGLLTVFAIVEHEDRKWAACEFVPARTLFEVLAGARCHPRWAREIIGDVANAVAELHARSLGHGDVSASSILITLKGKAKLSLTTAKTATDPDVDIRALISLLEEMSGPTESSIGETNSAAVLSATLRTPVKNLREEPS